MHLSNGEAETGQEPLRAYFWRRRHPAEKRRGVKWCKTGGQKRRQCRNVLVEAGRVGVFILLDDGDNKRDELGPKIQVLDAGSLLLGRHGSLLGLETEEENQRRSSPRLQT